MKTLKQFNKCNIQITFKYYECNEKLLTVKVNDMFLNPIDNIAIWKDEIELPCTINIVTSGKNPKYDTKIDKEGNIFEDLAVQIESIYIDSFPLNDIYLHQKIKIITDDGHIHTTSYFGFNGVIKLEFLESNIFAQVLKANSQ